MTIEIRKPEPGEFEDLLRSAWPAFGGHADEDKEEFAAELRIHVPDRALGAVERGRFVGELMGAPFQLTVPGGVLPAAGVTSAGVLPTHRRRGILSSLMKRNLEEVHERGEPLSVLHASEGPIYGRFGFGIATWVARLAIDRNRTGFVPGAPSPVGSIRFLDRDEALRSMPSVYDAIRPNQPGMVDRSEEWWKHVFIDPKDERDGASAFFFAGHESSAGLLGYAVYRVKSDWGHGAPGHTLIVKELLATTPQSYAALWRYCFDVDLVAAIQAGRRPSDEPLLHLVSDPRRLNLTLSDGTWVRIVDVERALQGRRYASTESVVLAVRDGFCEWNEGRYRLEGGPDEARCARTTEDPDLILSAGDLGAVYLGGNRFDALARAGRVEEPTPGAIRRADRMFASTPEPWNPHEF